MRFSLPPLKKPIQRPSGDQNGRRAPSLPVMAWLSMASKRRSHSLNVPSADRAPNTRRLPSGDTAMSIVPRGNRVPSGGGTTKLTRAGVVGLDRITATAPMPSTATAMVAAIAMPPRETARAAGGAGA